MSDGVPRQADDTDRLLLTQKRNGQRASGSPLPRGGSRELSGGLKVGDMNHAPIQEGPTRRIIPRGTARERPLVPLDALRAHCVMTGEMEHLTIEPQYECPAAATQRCRVPSDRIEDGLDIRRRAADHA